MQFPNDYQPAWWPAEDVVVDMVQLELDRCNPGGYACTWLPRAGGSEVGAEARIERGEAIVRVHAMPGALFERKLRYTPIQLEVLASRRDVSMQTFEFLSDVLCEKYRDGGPVPRADGSSTPIRGFHVSETQQELVFTDPDDRLVQGTFTLATGKRH
ncbi:hypothetical protein [Gordonia sp. (in: high G+C Gram-positive bacteria)]|uniref:phage tail termination protein n=1 Tax=Gordonia sp. (in: high G+C Gram-positive bacteria) TaxID=84139 RepID=UPI0039E2ACAE